MSSAESTIRLVCKRAEGTTLVKEVPLSAKALYRVGQNNQKQHHTTHTTLLSESDNQLTALPPEIGNLTKLIRLYRE